MGNSSTRKKLVREGDYVAEVEVTLTEAEAPWGPYLSPDQAEKLDQTRQALRSGNLNAARRHGRVYRLEPVSE